MGIGVLAIPNERKTADGERTAALIESCMGLRGLEVSKILQPLQQRWMFLG